jgi:uncharacterized protein with HEPN domain
MIATDWAISLNQSNIPWSKVIGMRHILVHGYFDIDLPLVWNVVERELPELKRQIIAILNVAEES